MPKSPWLATLVAVVLSSCFSSSVDAQGTPSVVVLDVARVFKEHTRFKQSMETMKTEVEAIEADVHRRRAKIQEDAKAARNHQVGSPEYQRLETSATKAMSELQVDMTLKRKDLMKRESRLYYDTYQEIARTVATFADRNGIRLVLRFSSEKMKPDDRASVMQGVGADVVFQRNIDITDVIIREVNRGTAAAGRPGAARPR